jgi:hypothetical protein
LKEAINAIENGTTSLKKANKHSNILLMTISNQLYGKTRFRKLAPTCVLTVEED